MKYGILVAMMMICLGSCRNSDDGISCFPNSVVDVVLNLNLPQNLPLQSPNGYVLVNTQSSGTRGLIVVNTGTGFRAFDRNAPHICPGENTTLVVEGGTKIVCPADNAGWFLTSGQPLEGGANRALVAYAITVSDNNLIISN